MEQNFFDVMIVGAGPAGIFAALELNQQPGMRIAILDKGADIDRRHGPIREKDGKCRNCRPRRSFLVSHDTENATHIPSLDANCG